MDEQEADDLRQLIVEEKRRIDALEDLIGTPVADENAYREAFQRLLEILPGDSRLRVTGTARSKMH